MTPVRSHSCTVFDNLPAVDFNTLHNNFCIFLDVSVGYRREEKENKSLHLTPQGDSSFVVMTNYIITEGQMLGKCPEVSDRVPHSFIVF